MSIRKKSFLFFISMFIGGAILLVEREGVFFIPNNKSFGQVFVEKRASLSGKVNRLFAKIQENDSDAIAISTALEDSRLARGRLAREVTGPQESSLSQMEQVREKAVLVEMSENIYKRIVSKSNLQKKSSRSSRVNSRIELEERALRSLFHRLEKEDWINWGLSNKTKSHVFLRKVIVIDPELALFLYTSMGSFSRMYMQISRGLNYDLIKDFEQNGLQGVPEKLLPNDEKSFFRDLARKKVFIKTNLYLKNLFIENYLANKNSVNIDEKSKVLVEKGRDSSV